MPPVKSAQEAILTAENFIMRYHAFRKLLRVQKEALSWYVEFDVGIVGREIVRIRLDPSTGEVIEYTSPEAK